MAKTYLLERAQLLEFPLDHVFAVFSDAGNLEALTPPTLKFKVTTPLPIEMVEGALIDYRLHLYGVPFNWRTRIDIYEPQQRFVDRQLRGPYKLWRHEHLFYPVSDGVLMVDRVHYEIPYWIAGRLAHAAFVRSTLDKIFDYRRQQTPHLLKNCLQPQQAG